MQLNKETNNPIKRMAELNLSKKMCIWPTCKQKKIITTNYEENENQNLHKISPHSCEKRLYQKHQKHGIGEDVEKKKSTYTTGRDLDWFSHMENNMKVSQKIENRSTI